MVAGWCIFLLNEELQKPRILKITGYCWWKKSGSPVDVVVFFPLFIGSFVTSKRWVFWDSEPSAGGGAWGLCKPRRSDGYASDGVHDAWRYPLKFNSEFTPEKWDGWKIFAFPIVFFGNFSGRGRGSWGSTLEYTSESESTCFFLNSLDTQNRLVVDRKGAPFRWGLQAFLTQSFAVSPRPFHGF